MSTRVRLTLMPELNTRRALAGKVLRDYIDLNGWDVADVARNASVDRKTLYNIFEGLPSVGAKMFRRVEGSTEGIPRFFFDHVLNGDAEAIEQAEGIDEELRRAALDGLQSPQAPRSRRRTGRTA